MLRRDQPRSHQKADPTAANGLTEGNEGNKGLLTEPFVLFVVFCSVFLDCFLLAATYAAELRVSRTGNEMIVDHAGRLHQRVANRRTDKFKSAPEKIMAHCIGFNCARGHLGHAPPAILDWLPIDEAPKVSVETPEPLLHSEKIFCVLDRGRDFQSVPHNPGVAE